MSIPTVVDLTAQEDGSRGRLVTFTSGTRKVQNATGEFNISLPHTTSPSKKRKRNSSSSIGTLAAQHPPDCVFVEDSELQDLRVAITTPLPKGSTTSGATMRQWNKTEGRQPQGRPIDLTQNDNEEAIELINRAFPVSGDYGARRASRMELLAHPIQMEEDEENISVQPDFGDSSSQHDFADSLTSDDSLSDRDLRRWLRNIQLEEEAREEAQANQKVVLGVFRGRHFTCAPGKAVELEDGSFLSIKKVTQDRQGHVFIQGLHLIRQNFIGLKMAKRKNEVIWLQQMTKTDDSAHLQQYEVSVSRVRKNRAIIFTNHSFPDISSRTDRDSFLDPLQDVELGPLFCRWKMTVVTGPKNRIVEESIEHLRFQDADDKVRCTNLGQEAYTRIADMRSRFNWRKTPNMTGGSQKLAPLVVDLDNETKTAESQAYTFGDAFCGAGGTSRGALDAGLFVKWGFDMDEQAITSYYQNFGRGGTDCRHEAVHEFLRRVHHNPPTVDVMHVSPPCQPFSHAHTWASPVRDERNQAALFSVWHLVETMKPRAVTVEETDAIISRHNEWFSALINIFVNLGYSVRWKTLRCQNYAVPQSRKRLFIIASG